MRQRLLAVMVCGLMVSASAARAQEAVLRGGYPVLHYTSVDGHLNTYVHYGQHQGKTVFRFLAAHDHFSPCNGYLYVSRSGIQYDPEYSPEFSQDAFDASWDEIEGVERSGKDDDYGMTVRLKKRKYNFHPAVVNDELQQIHPVWKWGSIVEFFLLTVQDFDAAVSRFRKLTADLPGYRFIPRPLSPEQTAAVESAEAKARAAEEAGQVLEALGYHMAALKALPQAPDLEVDRRVRSRLIEVVGKMETPPPLPEEARRRIAYAKAALEGASTAAQYDKALAEFYAALKAAPWFAPLYFDTALVLEEGGYLDSARSHLQLYLLAAPNAEDRDAVQQKIYSLEYKANNE